MTNLAVELKGATHDAQQTINKKIAEADSVTSKLLEKAVAANSEEMRFMLRRDSAWYTFHWNLFGRYLTRPPAILGDLVYCALVGVIVVGMLIPSFLVDFAQEFKLSFMSPLFQYGTMPYLTAAIAFYCTRTFYKYKTAKARYESFGISHLFLKRIPARHIYRGWAITDHALYMVDSDNDGAKAEVKRVPWSDISTVLYSNDPKWGEGIRVLDLNGQVLQGFNYPTEVKGVSPASVANFMRAKASELAIQFG